jgi:hypothetical protein
MSSAEESRVVAIASEKAERIVLPQQGDTGSYKKKPVGEYGGHTTNLQV